MLDEESVAETEPLSGGEPTDLIPARMLNEYVYCARLSYLEWVESEFADNAFTEEGRYRHRRVDAEEGRLPQPEEWEFGGRLLKVRGAMVSGPNEGLIARIDMVELRKGVAAPIDYKRGSKPNVPGGVYDPERVQVCAQGLILRENGWVVEGGWIYYVESRERVWIPFDDALVDLTHRSVDGIREMTRRDVRPPPLVDSPKCNGCSLSGICLPDEVGLLSQTTHSDQDGIRRLLAPRDDALPLYVQQQGLYLGLNGDVLEIRDKGTTIQEARLIDVSQVNLLGNIQASTYVVRRLCRDAIPLCYFTMGGWFVGMTQGLAHKNVLLRQHQYRVAFDSQRCLEIARSIVATKILNARALLMRNHADLDRGRRVELARYARAARAASDLPALLGLEGAAARIYFAEFAGMLKRGGLKFDFNGRNRRPPRDPINALLSLAYSVLTKELTVTAQAVGFDPFQGFYHQPHYGRPALALDLMEEFRPVVADSAVLWAINNGVITPSDFVSAGNATTLTATGRRTFLEAFERRLDETVTHPVFGYRVNYRRLFQVQTRLLARYLEGEIPDVPAFRIR